MFWQTIHKGILLAALGLPVYLMGNPDEKVSSPEYQMPPGLNIVKGIHVSSGLVVKEGFEVVVVNCVPCHSGKLIAQNRATRDGWRNLIRRMQKTQKLWDLGENEDRIFDYLANNYAPTEGGRRAPLKDIQWYFLAEE